MPGTIPEVEIVIWRAPKFRIFLSFNARIEAKTLSSFNNGSPIPIKTILLMSAPFNFSIIKNCPKISPRVKFLLKPFAPVSQKIQPKGQPAWLDIHAVLWPP